MTTRNSNAHFELAPQVTIERSTFDRSCNVKTSFNVGQLIPFFVDEVLPGDTFQIETSKVARLQTLLTPVMDNLYLDTYYFFVPNRLVWQHWREFCGENTASSWYQQVEYTIPQLIMPEAGWNVGTIADYFGIPTGVTHEMSETPFTVNALPFRAYALICNEWFRDENIQEPLVIPMGDSDTSGSNGGGYDGPAKGGRPFVACKMHDYFTSCLPGPLKAANDVSFLEGVLPVHTYTKDFFDGGSTTPHMRMFVAGDDPGSKTKLYLDKDAVVRVGSSGTSDATSEDSVYPVNLGVDLSGDVWMKPGPNNSSWSVYEPFTINKLREAFQVQRMFEKDARGGTRYIEILKSHFGVTSPDARLQRPEYLGGNRVPLNVEQVIQTSGDTEMSVYPLGTTGGWSQTNDTHYDVEKSFVEHGFIIGLMCARYDHSYQQGIERMWTRETRFEYYWPALAHLGEKAVYTDELCLDPYNGPSKTVFGYQEAWAEYRFKPNYITGQMRSAANGSLDIWHFADFYAPDVPRPTLSEDWIIENKTNVDRALAVTSVTANQIFADILVKNKCTRPMPLYSIPGLIDHF